MRNVDILVNGIIAHVDYDSALSVINNSENWINAFPLTSGRYSGKVIPFKRNLAPIVLDRLRIVSMLPFIDNTHEEVSERIVKKFAFAAIVTLSSTEHEAVEFALLNGTWLLDRTSVAEILWSSPERVGAFETLIPPEARTL
jgi:hypothetical protein